MAMQMGSGLALPRKGLVVVLACFGMLFFAGRSFGSGVEIAEPSQAVSAEEIPLLVRDLSLPPGLKHLTGISGSRLDRSIVVEVLRFGQPAPGETVSFRVLLEPSGAKGTELSATEVLTDEEGKAAVEFVVGSKTGDYVVGAYHDGKLDVEPARIPVKAKAQSWVFFLLVGLLGGLGIFLLGMEMAGDGLKNVAGDKMRGILSALTSNRFFGLLVGALVTGILQSSSVTTVMLVGFVSATMMTLVQAIGVMMGAKIGTTITAQIVAFNVSEYALLFVALGVGLKMAGWNRKVKQIGDVVLGFGLLFFGLGVMSSAMKPLRSVPAFTELLLSLASQPLLAVLISVAFTAIVQSSSATIGLVIALCAGGLLSLEAGLPLAWGAHIGTCATALLSSLGTGREGKQVAVSHLLYSVLTVIVAFPFLPYLVDGARELTAWMGSDAVARQVANGHTLFTVATGLLFLAVVPQLAWLTKKIVPDTVGEPPFGPQFLSDQAMAVPVLALEQAQLETLRMAGIARSMFEQSMDSLESPSEEATEFLKREDDKLDILERAIRPFLADVARAGLPPDMIAHEHAFIYIVQDLESVGDVLSKEIAGVVFKLADRKQAFSPEGLAELRHYHEKLVEKFGRVEGCIKTLDRGVAEQVVQLGFKEKVFERGLREAHLERLHSNREQTVATSALHLSVLGNFRAIGDRLEAIAQTIMTEL
jgi:phosphate:Na+ symporter